MPYYEIEHSYPLEPSQRQELASTITKLHSHTFTTPSIFVNVHFKACDATDYSYYVAGEPRNTNTNRIHANVRTGSRTKKDFDDLAAKIEGAWKDAIDGEKITEGKDKGKRKGEVDETDRQREAKELLFVVFSPMITVRERGMVICEAGKEAEFYKENMSYIKEMAELGEQDFKGMLEELETREDLKKLVNGGTMEKLGLGGNKGAPQNGEQK